MGRVIGFLVVTAVGVLLGFLLVSSFASVSAGITRRRIESSSSLLAW
jgi:hypothetical protein